MKNGLNSEECKIAKPNGNMIHPLCENAFWWDEAPPRRIEGTLPASTDVLVVGAGFTGLSAALSLLKAGHRVVVCEKEGIGHGASTRNGGQISAKLRRGLGSIAKEHGEDTALSFWMMAREAREFLEARIVDENIDCNFKTGVRFQGAYKKKDYKNIVESARLIKEKIGLPLKAVPADEQRAYVNTDAYYGGVLDASTASFHPAKYIRGISQLIESQGGVVRSHTPVMGIKRNGSTLDITTPSGVINAKTLIVATNGYTGPEFPAFAKRMIPIGSYVIATEPMSREHVDKLMPGCDLVIDTRRAASYMRVSPDRTRILYGGRVAATDITALKSGPRLKAILDDIFPSLKDVGISHAWMGFTGFSLDQLPHIYNEDNIYYAGGYCGTGTAMATYLGHMIAEKISGTENQGNKIFELNFPTSHFYSGKPWFLSSIIGVYRALDRFRL